MMLLIAGLGRLIPKVHVQQTLGLGFIKVFGQRNLGSQNATGLVSMRFSPADRHARQHHAAQGHAPLPQFY